MKPSDMVRALAPEDQPAEEDALGAFMFPLRFLGMGLLIAWLCCTHVSSIFPGPGLSVEIKSLTDTFMRIGDIGTFVVLACMATRIGPISRHPVNNAIWVCLTSLGTVLLGFIIIPSAGLEALAALVSVITAVGGAILFCLWAEAYSQMGVMRMMVYGAASCLTAFAAFLIISVMEPPFGLVATSCLPIISLLCAWLSFRVVPKERPHETGVRYRLPWKLLLMMSIAGVVSGTSSIFNTDANASGALHRIEVTGLAGIAILVMIAVMRERCDARFLARMCLPIALIGFLLLPFVLPDNGAIVSFLIKFAYVWFTFFVLLMLANISYRFDVPSLRLFAIARACSEGAILVGVQLRGAIGQADLIYNELFLVAASVVGVLLVVVCVLIWHSEKAVTADWGASGINVETGMHVAGPRERLLLRLGELSDRFGLTDREAEILGLIAQKKSRAEIEQELFLSQNTVKTHVRHLYAKLGVHSKTDVYDLFEHE